MSRTAKQPPNLSRHLRWLGRFAPLRIGVLGDFAVDHYLVGKTSRISREAPVLILKKQEDSVRPGQAGNSAANLAALGVQCFAFGIVGPDREGARLVDSLKKSGVNTSGMITSRKGHSIIKTRIFAGAHHTALQQVIRMDDDESLEICACERKELKAKLSAALPKLDAVLVSDYGYGSVSLELWKLIGDHHTTRILDSRYSLETFTGADVITPNETEVFAHLGIERISGADPIAAGQKLIEQTRARGLVMTRGNEGMIVFDGGAEPRSIPIFGGDEVTDVTGAGDTVAATVTAVMAAGGSLMEAAELANVAAGLKVMKRGSATVSPEEIQRAVRARR